MTKTKRRHNKKWQDTTNAERQAERRNRLKQSAEIAGFDTIDRLAAAIIAGSVKIVKNRKEI